ncbi:adenylate/guanylate cyclase domain-containing protein [Myxococcota bacterium]|nr:adenylate/guanylate cyclase domain-containing protein [Myxococcota bacterium]
MASLPLSDLDPDLVAPDLSTRLVRALLAQVEEDAGAAAARALVDAGGLPRAWLDDPENRVAALYVDRLARALLRQQHGLDEPPPHDHPAWQTWRRVGRRALTRDAMGAGHSVVRAIGSPGAFYARLPDLARRVNRLLELSHEVVGPGHVRIHARPSELAPEGWRLPGHTCWNLFGILEAVPTVWGLPRAQVERRSCEHAQGGAGGCTYEVRFVARSRLPMLLLGLGAAGALAVGLWLPGTTAHLAGLCLALAVLAVAGWLRVRALQAALRREAERIDGMIRRHDERMGELFEEGLALRRALLASRKLSGYLASDLVERIVDDPEVELSLGGQRTEAAVLFADIVGFTPRCEPLPPEQVVEELNLYFAHVDPAFQAHGGVIDKRMGDGIMAVFVPRRGEAAEGVHARAVGCALDMQRALGPCNEALAARGSAPIRIRVGVAAGPLVQGNMGSAVKLEYTVIGDTVNLAARLESSATPGHVLVQAAALPERGPQTGPFTVTSRRTITVKGKQQAIEVVELAAL